MTLLGVDVGFSKAGQTTGIAYLDNSRIYLKRAKTSWEHRRRCLPPDFRPIVIALDGPLVPSEADKKIRRRCEHLFVHSPFHNRCKPGLSDWGAGLQLREATTEARRRFSTLFSDGKPLDLDSAIRRNGSVVEAFPNAFLCVLLTGTRVAQYAKTSARKKI
jgi:predicted RNase H-like nuclease